MKKRKMNGREEIGEGGREGEGEDGGKEGKGVRKRKGEGVHITLSSKTAVQ